MSRQDAHRPIALDFSISELQARVGQRVRSARTAQGMSRRVLSEASGVSPRYLAQLEAGQGNISIGLLLRVSAALDLPIVSLLDEAGPDASRIAAAFVQADERTQSQVEALLSGVSKAGRVGLIGLRGAGKSTLGAAAADAFDAPFIELNAEIEAAGGMPVSEIMALYGAEGYRQLESDALGRIEAAHDRAVVAVSGGIVADGGTFDHLLERFHTIWLRATPEEHMDRVRAQGDTRPMAGNPEAMAQLRGLLNAREAEYARADARLDTSGVSVAHALRDLVTLIEARGFLAKEARTP